MWPGSITGGSAVICLLLASFIGVASVCAQESTVVPTIGEAMSVAEIQECLCTQERIGAERLALETQERAIEDRAAALEVLDEQIDRQRTTMDPADMAARDILKALIQEQVALRTLLQSELRPNFSRRVSALGDWVESYNQECATRVRYQTDEDLARRDLQCASP